MACIVHFVQLQLEQDSSTSWQQTISSEKTDYHGLLWHWNHKIKATRSVMMSFEQLLERRPRSSTSGFNRLRYSVLTNIARLLGLESDVFFLWIQCNWDFPWRQSAVNLLQSQIRVGPVASICYSTIFFFWGGGGRHNDDLASTIIFHDMWDKRKTDWRWMG